MSEKKDDGKWIDCGDGMLKHPVSGSTSILTRVVELEGFGRIGEWWGYGNDPEKDFQKILHSVNSHAELVAALESCLEWMEFIIPRLNTSNTHRMNWGGPIHKTRTILAKVKGTAPSTSEARPN
jgi:hypothetical protein